MRRTTSNPSDGFTLIELLVVMAILAVLGGVAIFGIPGMLRSADKQALKVYIEELSASVENYANNPRNGDFPPTTLAGMAGEGGRQTRENCGIESLVICLNRGAGSRSFDESKTVRLENLDGDESDKPMASFAVKDLFELVDIWGTPLAYFHHRDYGRVDRDDLGTVSGNEDSPIDCRPWKNLQTGNWFQPARFQIISAGPDGLFNTEDDITNFER